jgi:uncharacterized protein involved in exopolysaccharide biosynthesis
MDQALAQYDPSGAASPGQRPRREDIAVSELLTVARARLRLILGIIGGALGLALLAVLLWPVTYEAKTLVVLETRDRQVSEVKSVVANLPRDLYVVDTEVQIMGSEGIAARVAKRLKLDADPDFAEQSPGAMRPARANAEAEIRLREATRALRDSVRIARPGLSYAIEVTAKAKTPEKAAAIANTFAEIYLEQQRDAKYMAVASANDVLLTRLADLRGQVREKEEAIERFRTNRNLLGAQGVTLTESQISDLSKDLSRYRAQLAEAEARLDVARVDVERGGAGDAFLEALRSDVVRDLRSQQLAFDRRAAELSTQLGPKHPTMQALAKERGDLDARLDQELRRILKNLEAEVRIARERYEAVSGMLGEQRQELSRHNLGWVQLRELERDADATRAVYASFLSAYQRTAQGVDVEVPDARIPAPAMAPLDPAKPSLMIFLGLGGVLGTLLAAFLVYALELFQRSLRNAADVERRLGLPCVGVLPTIPVGDRAPVASDLDSAGSYPAFSEAVLSATVALTAGRQRQRARVVVLCGARAKDGSSWAAISIARMAARLGLKVVLIDGDGKNHGVLDAAGLEPQSGILEAALGRAGLAEAMMRDRESPIRIAALCGPALAAQPRGYGVDRLGPIFTALRKHFDLVIIDAPPALEVADARFFAEHADGVVIVGRWGDTPSRIVLDAIDSLQRAGGRVVGALIQRAPAQDAPASAPLAGLLPRMQHPLSDPAAP